MSHIQKLASRQKDFEQNNSNLQVYNTLMHMDGLGSRIQKTHSEE
jgi:hypothetical protein